MCPRQKCKQTIKNAYRISNPTQPHTGKDLAKKRKKEEKEPVSPVHRFHLMQNRIIPIPSRSMCMQARQIDRQISRQQPVSTFCTGRRICSYYKWRSLSSVCLSISDEEDRLVRLLSWDLHKLASHLLKVLHLGINNDGPNELRGRFTWLRYLINCLVTASDQRHLQIYKREIIDQVL